MEIDSEINKTNFWISSLTDFNLPYRNTTGARTEDNFYLNLTGYDSDANELLDGFESCKFIAKVIVPRLKFLVPYQPESDTLLDKLPTHCPDHKEFYNDEGLSFEKFLYTIKGWFPRDVANGLDSSNLQKILQANLTVLETVQRYLLPYFNATDPFGLKQADKDNDGFLNGTEQCTYLERKWAPFYIENILPLNASGTLGLDLRNETCKEDYENEDKISLRAFKETTFVYFSRLLTPE